MDDAKNSELLKFVSDKAEAIAIHCADFRNFQKTIEQEPENSNYQERLMNYRMYMKKQITEFQDILQNHTDMGDTEFIKIVKSTIEMLADEIKRLE